MLLKTHRFHGRTSLKNVYRYGKVNKNGPFSLRYQENPRRSSYRAAVVVSKKVEKSSVKRNRIRRRVFENIRASQTEINGPYDIIISVFSSSVANMTNAELKQVLHELLASAEIISKK